MVSVKGAKVKSKKRKVDDDNEESAKVNRSGQAGLGDEVRNEKRKEKKNRPDSEGGKKKRNVEKDGKERRRGKA